LQREALVKQAERIDALVKERDNLDKLMLEKDEEISSLCLASGSMEEQLR
jgi:hypothetical protein